MPTTRERRSDRHLASVPRLTQRCPGDEGHAAPAFTNAPHLQCEIIPVNVRTYVRPGQRDSAVAAVDCAAAVGWAPSQGVGKVVPIGGRPRRHARDATRTLHRR